MHCAGANFSVLKFLGYQCDVDPFHDTYQTTTGVDVITAATAVQLSAGDTLFLVSTAALWFSDTMETSLFNANIARDAGLKVCTNPMDPHQELGLCDQDRGLHIPFHRHRNFIGLHSYKPDPDDILQAMSNGDRNIIYLDLHADYEPTTRHTNEIEDHTLVSGINTKGRPTCHFDQCGQVDPDFLTLSQLSSTLNPTTFARDSIASINIANVRSSMITQWHSAVTPERVSEVFGCGLETAKQTIRVTTQHGIRSSMHPLRRHYRTDLLSLWYRHLNVLMYSDTMHFKVKSLNQNKCAQIFATDNYATAYPVCMERHIGDMLRMLAKDVGIPRELLTDNTNMMMGHEADFNKQAQFLCIKMCSIEPHNKKQNKGERVIGELRRRWQDKHRQKNMPRHIWDIVLVWCAQIFCIHTTRGHKGRDWKD